MLVAIWNKLIEFVVLEKVRCQGWKLTKFDGWVLDALHQLMLNQIERALLAQKIEVNSLGEVTSHVGVHNAKVVLSAPDLDWSAEATREADLLRDALGPRTKIYHIGSTAIHRLAAKPILDFAATLPVDVFNVELDTAKLKLRAVGYRYLGVRGGLFFEKSAGPIRTHALQLHPAGNPMLCELLHFRDALQSDETLRTSYETTKRVLAALFFNFRLFYVFYKSHWIDDWQWRHSNTVDWPSWFIIQKRTQAELAKLSRFTK